MFKKMKPRDTVHIVNSGENGVEVVYEKDLILLDSGNICFNGKVYESINSEDIPGYSHVYKMLNTESDIIIRNAVPNKYKRSYLWNSIFEDY